MLPFPLVLDKNLSVPLYYQLKQALLAQIKNGYYSIGDAIPTEMVLTHELEISRSTVRQAITELVQEGWLQRRPGKGTTVCASPRTSNVIHTFEPFYQQAQRLGMPARADVLSINRIKADEALAKGMNLSVGDEVISLLRCCYIGTTPTATIRSFLPRDIGETIIRHDLNSGSYYDILARFEESHPVRIQTVVSAEIATVHDCTHLHIDPNTAILCIQYTCRNARNRIVDYTFTRYRGDTSHFDITSCQE